MITREDITWTVANPICFVCRKNVNDIKVITFVENINNKSILFNQKEGQIGYAYKAIKVCIDCWKITAGEDWMFSE